METYHCIVPGPPFPSMGKGRDRGAPNNQSITPTLLLPRQGEGLPTIGQWPAPSESFEGGHQEHEADELKFVQPFVSFAFSWWILSRLFFAPFDR
jgi:hypothetical protein